MIASNYLLLLALLVTTCRCVKENKIREARYTRHNKHRRTEHGSTESSGQNFSCSQQKELKSTGAKRKLEKENKKVNSSKKGQQITDYEV
uniref:Secreted protein n=1 Tax=Globodera pallida TaxID=36090 RepID=A0A183C3A7_GLOPA